MATLHNATVVDDGPHVLVHECYTKVSNEPSLLQLCPNILIFPKLK